MSTQNIDGIYKLLQHKKAPDNCYVISEHSSVDDKILPLKDALSSIVGTGIAAIISCLPGHLAYYEKEEPGERYILEKQ